MPWLLGAGYALVGSVVGIAYYVFDDTHQPDGCAALCIGTFWPLMVPIAPFLGLCQLARHLRAARLRRVARLQEIAERQSVEQKLVEEEFRRVLDGL